MAPEIFKVLFGFVLIASAIYIFIRKKIENAQVNFSKQMMIFAVGASFFAGIISAFFGIGGGIIFVPLMVAGMGMAMKKAAPTSQLILLFASFSGIVVHTILGHSDFLQAGLLSAGSFAGGLVGARLSVDIKERFLQIIVSVVIIAAAIKMFFDSLADNLYLINN